MIEENQCSLLQQFSPQHHFIRRQVNHQQGTGNASKYVQTSVWDILKFIRTQIRQSNTTDYRQIEILKTHIFKFFEQLPRTFQKEVLLSQLLTEMKTVVEKQIRVPDNKYFSQKSYLSFCNVFLRQCIFYVLRLLASISLIDLNKELLSRQCLFYVSLKKIIRMQEFTFTLRLIGRQGEDDTNSTLNQKQKAQQQEINKPENQNKAADNDIDSHSLIDPLVSQRQQKSGEAIIMHYLKQLFPDNNFVILVSSKLHFYLINKTNYLGKGGFGHVYKSEKLKLINGQPSHSIWAIKELIKEIDHQNGKTIGQDRQYEMLTKIHKLSGMKMKNSRNIIEVQEVINFENRKYIIYQLCLEKDLRTFIKTNDRFTKKHLFMIIEQLAATLDLIHYKLVNNESDMQILDTLTLDGEIIQDNATFFQNRNYFNSQVGIIHRDLKLSNILVSYFSEKNIKIKIIDWAFSKRTLTDRQICTVHCGTFNYQAPQIINKKPFCCKVDVWAFGVIVYELFTGKQFVIKDDKEKIRKDDSYVKYKLKKMQFRNDKHLTQSQISYWKQLISQCLQFNPQNRFSSKQALDFIRKNGFYQPYTSQSVQYIYSLKMMRAQYFHHHNTILQLNPHSSIRTKILNKVAANLEEALCEIYEKFTRDKYWNSDKSELKWDFQKTLGRKNQKHCKKEFFQQCMIMLQDISFQHYPHNQIFRKLVSKVQQQYLQSLVQIE